jgi:hypothetical protein
MVDLTPVDFITGLGKMPQPYDTQQQVLGDQQRNQQNQNILATQALGLQAAKAKQALAEQYQGDVQNALHTGNFAALYAKYPDQQKELQAAHDALDEPTKRANERDLYAVHNFINSGNVAGAKAILQKRIDADRAAGQPADDDQQMLDEINSGDPKRVAGAAGLALFAILPEDKRAEVFGKPQDKNHFTPLGDGRVLDQATGDVTGEARPKPEYREIKVTNPDGSETTQFVDINAGGGGRASGGGAPSGSAGAPLSVRLNNPGSIRDNPANKWEGQIGSENGFAKFDTVEHGERAQRKLIANQIRNGYDTPLAWAQHYAPASDGNDPQAYAARVAAGLGIGINDKIPLGAVPKMAQLSAQVEAGGTPAPATLRDPGVVASYNTKPATTSEEDSGLSGDAYLATLPANVQAKIKAVAEGRAAAPRPGTKFGEALLNQVTQYDPTFDAANAQSRLKTRVDFTSGKSAQAVNALNTAMGHLIHLDDQAHDLGNNSFLPGFLNPIKRFNDTNIRGSSAYNTFDQTKQAAASELRKVFAGSAGGNLAELEAWEATLDSAKSYPQLHDAIRNGVDLMSSRLNSLQEQYSNGMGRSDQIPTFVRPSLARTAKQRFGIDLTVGSDAAPTQTATNPTTGQKIGLVGGKWVPIK